MSYGRNVIYLYDGTFEGVLTCIFDSYLHHEAPMSIEREEYGQLTLDSDYRRIVTDTNKAERVMNKIVHCAGCTAYKHMYYTYLSEKPLCEVNVADYVKMCLKYGKNADKHLTVPCVDFVLDTSLRVGHEAHKYTGFVRFSELEGGIYYSEIEPVYNILPIIAYHFEERYPTLPFLIHDVKRKLCLVYNGKESVIRETDSMPVLHLSEDEQQYRSLWKQFYDTIEIKERHNEKCRMTMMPKRYWKHMTEFDIAIKDSQAKKSPAYQGSPQISSQSHR